MCQHDMLDLLNILDAGPVSPEALAAMSQQRRRRTLDAVDTLISALDGDRDMDADLEDGADYARWDQRDRAGRPNEQTSAEASEQDGWRRPHRARVRYTHHPADAAAQATIGLCEILGVEPPRRRAMPVITVT